MTKETITRSAHMLVYEQQLKDKRWELKAENIRIRDKHKCRLCGANDVQLDVHHIRYIYGRAPWDYDDGDLVTLCHDCHEKFHAKQDFKDLMPGDYFYSKLLDGVGIVERKQSNSIWFHLCWTEDNHCQEKGHGRLYFESEAYQGDVRAAKPYEITEFWKKVEKYYDIDQIIIAFGTHLRSLLPDEHPLRVKAREKYKEAISLFNKQRKFVKDQFDYYLLVSDNDFAEFKNRRISSYKDWSDTTFPYAYFHVACKKDVKEKPLCDNSKEIPYDKFDYTGYHAATLEEVNEWSDYLYHLDSLHENDLPF